MDEQNHQRERTSWFVLKKLTFIVFLVPHPKKDIKESTRYRARSESGWIGSRQRERLGFILAQMRFYATQSQSLHNWRHACRCPCGICRCPCGIVPCSQQQQKRGKDTSAAKMNSISTFIVWFVVAFLCVWTFFGATLEVENGTKVTIAKTPTSKLSIMMTMMMFVFSSIRSMVVTQWDGLVRPGPTSSHH